MAMMLGHWLGLRYVGGRRALLWGNDWSDGCWQPEGWPGFEVVGRCDELTGAVDLQQLRHEQR